VSWISALGVIVGGAVLIGLTIAAGAVDIESSGLMALRGK
jgi:hypothetical protein